MEYRLHELIQALQEFEEQYGEDVEVLMSDDNPIRDFYMSPSNGILWLEKE